jgi:predicted permease
MLSDLKYAIRQLVKNPGFSAGVILILALGIGANITEFSLMNAVLLKPLPWRQADRLVYVWYTAPMQGWPFGPISIPGYIDCKNQTDVFEDATAFTGANYNLSTGLTPEPVIGISVTSSFFSTLGIQPALGRSFTLDETVPGRDKVVIISFELWQTQLGGRSDILGSNLRLNGENYRVVGVMPMDFVSPRAGLGPISDKKVGMWVPYAFAPSQLTDTERGNWNSIMIARLKPGVTVAQAQQVVDLVQQRIAERTKDKSPSRKEGGFGCIVVNYREQNVQGTRAMLLILQATVALVLLIACGNVANLLLVRANARTKEMAIRLALGAGRWCLAKQIFTENLLLVMIGGAFGVLIGDWGLRSLKWFPSLPNDQAIAIDGRVLGFALAVSLASGLLVSAVLVISFWWRVSGDGWREGNTRGSRGRSAGLTRGALIVGEVALALMLLVASGLTLKSFAKLQAVQPGFNAESVLTAQLSLPVATYKDGQARTAFFAEALRRMRALPGVKSASATSQLPFGGMIGTGSYSIKGLPRRRLNEPGLNAHLRAIDPNYFQTMQIPLVRGRLFSDADTAEAPLVVVIDQFLAARWFAKQDPVGQQIKLTYSKAPWCTIVGVVGSVKTTTLADPITKETLYFPLAQNPYSALSPTLTFVLKTDGDPRNFVAPVERVVREMDPELPIFDIRTLDQRVADSLADYRSPTLLLAIFGVSALLLAALGLYGVLAYSVSQRTRELGIRIALGAQAQSIINLVVGQGLRLTLFGLILGFAASLGLSGLLRSLLFGVSTNDPTIYAVIPGLLLLVALLACYLPARRATRVDPVVALRSE